MSQGMPVLQEDKEEESLSSPSHASDGPCSPEAEEEKTHDPPADERVFSVNCPDSKASVVLTSRNLWRMFDAIGTEMIVTRRGRRMFPAIKVEVYDLKPDISYVLLMDMAPVDKYRYKYNAGWVRCFEEECAPTRLYIHPDSPAFGSHWTSVVINFYKLKLTNNQLDKQGHIIVNSMHRYQPRLHIVESDDINSLNWETRQTFIFPGTQFTTVTAYQNDKITQLKIQNNPFAKGFRSPFSRCRSRNPPGPRFTIRSNSCSDSGVEEQPQTISALISPQLLLTGGHDVQRIAGIKRKTEASEAHLAVRKQVCMESSQNSSHKPLHQLVSTSEAPPVFVIYQPVVSTAQPDPTSVKTILQPRGGHIVANTMYTIVSPTESLAQMSSPQMIASSLPTLSRPAATPKPSPSVIAYPSMADSKPVHVIVSSVESRKPAVDISCLTKEGVAGTRSVPPLLQVMTQDKLHSPAQKVKGQELPQAGGQELLLVQAPPNRGQRLLIVGEKTEGAAQVRLTPTQQPQVVIPVAYDQQVMSMPIYRVGSQPLQPVQILTTLPPGASPLTTT